MRRGLPHALAALIATVLPAAAGATTISSGHADVGGRLEGGRLQLMVKDASTGTVKWRRPSAVTFRVGPRARMRVPAAQRSLIGSTRAWMLPQSERRGVPWVGWSTQEIARSQVRGTVSWGLTRVVGPGRVVVFQTSSLGRVDELFSSAKRSHGSVRLEPGTHAHGTWAFTRPGSYRLTFRMAVRLRSGRLVSDRQAIRVRVG